MSVGRPGGESKWVWLVVVLAVLLGVVAFLNRPAPTESAADPSRRQTTSETPSATPATEKARKKPRATASPTVDPAAVEGLGLPAGVQPPGLGGSGTGKSLPRAKLTVRITSDQPVHHVSYIIPTSDREQYGKDTNAGRTWTYQTTVWGRPDYAAVFVRGLYPGVKVTCVITVNGRETERRTIIGPYSAMWCQG